MNELQVHLPDENATILLGAKLGGVLNGGATVYLQGQLGAGKTTLCRGLLRSWGYQGAVKSPTYTLVEPYEFNGHKLYHFDLYRLASGEELEFMGIRDYFAEGNLCLIEWPERGERFLPEADLIVTVSSVPSGATMARNASLKALSSLGVIIVERLSAQLYPNE